MTTTEARLHTAVHVAKRLNIGRTTVFDLVRRGLLHPVRIRRCLRFTEAELQRFIAEHHDGDKADTDQ